MIKFCLIKERKNPPDRRVVFSPEKLLEAVEKFPQAEFKVEASDIRIFPDEEYQAAGFDVASDVSDCEVMLGVKEVPIAALIPNKKYFFFSHTIKQQPYNRELLRAVLAKNIELYDHEVISSKNGSRLIGFGRYAGIVGAYNAFRAVGLKLGLYELPKVTSLADYDQVLKELNAIQVPPLKIVLTGSGKVAYGAKEVLDHLNIQEVTVEEYLTRKYDSAVYCRADILDYNKRKDGKNASVADFYRNPLEYVSNFGRFTKVSDMFIAGHFYGEGAPFFYSRKEVKAPDFKIRFVADISCDIDGPVATTLRASTIADPIYGYDPETEKETDFMDPSAITVMAVDNLPCELPKDASEGFGEMFLENVLPAFFNNDKDGILERARMTKDGQLTDRYSYLKDYVAD